jgi:hypothetical protein
MRRQTSVENTRKIFTANVEEVESRSQARSCGMLSIFSEKKQLSKFNHRSSTYHIFE